METPDADEERSIRRFTRFEWLLRQVEEAAMAAQARARLEHALRQLLGDTPRTPHAPGRA